MSGESTIEWTGVSWKTVAGCTAVGPGCTHCYATNLAARYRGRDRAKGITNGFWEDIVSVDANGKRRHFSGKVKLMPDQLQKPLKWKHPSAVFVNSEADTFHEKVPDKWIEAMFEVMNTPGREAWWFQLLTKRSERLRELGPSLPWADHIWVGVSVENADKLPRVDDLRACGATGKWLSLEPLLGPLDDLDVKGIDWVVVGGESQNGGDPARRLEEQWVRDIYAKCQQAGVPMFMKQWGQPKYNPLTIEGKTDPTLGNDHPDHAKGGCMVRRTDRSKPRVIREVPEAFRHFFTGSDDG